MCSEPYSPGDFIRVECMTKEGTRFVVFGYMIESFNPGLFTLRDDERRYEIDQDCVQSVRLVV